MAASLLTGGCLCGVIRYEISGEPHCQAYCHCSMCRQASGAPVTAWLTVDRERLRFTSGQPSIFHSSINATRAFCNRCGTPLVFFCDEQLDTCDVTLGSLDEPKGYAPQFHVHEASRLEWFNTNDNLPRHAGMDTSQG